MIHYLHIIIRHIAYRTTKKFNVLKIRSLSPNYYDKDTLILHTVMQLIVDYVEIELGAAFYLDKSKKSLKRNILTYLPWFIRPDFRSREMGLKHIQWMKNITDTDALKYCSHQANFANDLEKIYLWWTDIYPNRKLPEVASGFSKLFNSANVNENELEKALRKCTKIEKEYLREENRMLKLAIDIRDKLWT